MLAYTAILIAALASQDLNTANLPPVDQRPQAEATPDAEAGDPERQVCRTERPVGSRMGTRICLTAREWDQLSDRSRAVADNVRQRSEFNRDFGSGRGRAD